MDVIKQLQQAIVYIEDRITEPFNFQELSDYVGLSPYHLDQSFKMIVGLSPSNYAQARKMTLAAEDMIQNSSRLVDVAKKYQYANANDFANDFSRFHGLSPIQASTKKNELKIQKRVYIKLSTTEREPFPYRLEETSDIALVGHARYINTNQLSNPFNVPDFLEDLYLDGKIKDLLKYNNISPYELFVISCPLDNGLEIFVGVPSDRYPMHLESRRLPGRHYAKFNLHGEIDYAVNEAWHFIETSLQLTLPYERDSLYVEIYPHEISFEQPTKIQLWLPIQQETYHVDSEDEIE
ncbi:AraC family transcriptional regulator [Staphylococcus lugdunensis]|uniref:AraC family transcriptional regulator n=1 Tax=Staphylococcus lugdunensis TaxID=28035 RepID=UPI000213A19E|nr:AraC family transcriptional regulator [Staphylococcus lugdunensis]ARJ09265.1 AraC family transcriptional regulator [Staphylococcus lugdunensis]EKS25553.1 hypothetical protein HMPREF9308_00404 [Staphylococcus lugdunensis ACS-027-V-Sch2]MCH8676928.1 AraC family transcriptional regulator [Staphylococcus lugdunensis]MCI2758561.1 AraC family transcriptional regulator [Staphylococcus lugdunensis]MCI2763519.1 AraC family transcriptional regulator [Staphylococcus lugdunensis]